MASKGKTKRRVIRRMDTFTDYTATGEIGRGTFGRIYKAQNTKDTKEYVAIKVIDLTKCDDKDKEHMENERRCMQTLDHPNLVKYIHSFHKDDGRKLCIVMELCESGTLRQYIENTGVTEDVFISLSTQICRGLKYMHDRNLLHRDVKTTNIFLTKKEGKLVVKIGDFGLVKQINETKVKGNETKYVGTPAFMSLEIVEGQIYDKTTDIWSLGCCLYEMALNKILIPNSCATVLDIRNFLRDCEDKLHVSLEDCSYCEHTKSLISSLLRKDPTKRATVDDVLCVLTSEEKTKPPRTDFSQTYPPSIRRPASTPRPNLKPIAEVTSGYDSSDGEGDCNYVSIPVTVKMKKEEAFYYEKSKEVIRDLQETFELDGPTIENIVRTVEKTRRMDNDAVFKSDMAKVLGNEKFYKVKGMLNALWGYMTEVKQSKFPLVYQK